MLLGKEVVCAEEFFTLSLKSLLFCQQGVVMDKIITHPQSKEYADGWDKIDWGKDAERENDEKQSVEESREDGMGLESTGRVPQG